MVFWIISTKQPVSPVITCWLGKLIDVLGITGDPRILILDGLTPFGVEWFVPRWLW